jgi:hypothetical protein
MPNGMSKEQQELLNRVFLLVERVVEAYEFDVATRRRKLLVENPAAKREILSPWEDLK